MKIFSLIIFVCFIVSCKQKISPGNQIETSAYDDIDWNKELYDSLQDQPHQHYLTDLPLNEVVTLILNDSVRPSDNEITFKIMDSIFSKTKATRQFYLPAFNKILDKSDGALAEAACQYVLKFLETYPDEFAKNLSLSNPEYRRKLAGFAGYELSFSYETIAEAEEWLDKIVSECTSCDSIQLKALKNFNQQSISAIKAINED